MKYYEFGSDSESIQGKMEIVDSYIMDVERIKTWPSDMSKGDRLIAWLLMVNIHAIACQTDNEDDSWRS